MRQRVFIYILPVIVFYTPLFFSQGSGNSLTFNGNNTYIDLGTQMSAGVRTIEMWFQPAATINASISNAITLVARDYANGNGASTNEFGLAFVPAGWTGLTAGKLIFFRRLGSASHTIQSDNTSWTAGVWYHVAAVIDPVTGMKMYINGILQQDNESSTLSIPAQSGAVTDMVAIGKWGYWNGRYFNGEIDEVRFWNTARSQTQVRDKMCSKLNGSEPGLQAYYRFDNNSGSTLSDASVNGYNAQIYNFSLNPWHYSSAPVGDTSVYAYPVNNFNLQFSPSDNFSVFNISSSANGAHIYRVNSSPNSNAGLTNTNTNYYGVWLADTTGTYDIQYLFGNGSNCSCSNQLFARSDNAVSNWVQLATTFAGCTLSKTNESSMGVSYRSEYILNEIQSPVVDLGNDTSCCEGSTVILNAGISDATYTWNTGSSEQIVNVSTSGSFSVLVQSYNCLLADTINITILPTPLIDLGSDTIICASDTFLMTLQVQTAGLAVEWSDGENDNNMIISEPGCYWIHATNEYGCNTSDSIVISQLNLDLGPDTNICEENAIILKPLNACPETTTFQWANGDSAFSTTVFTTGQYWLEMSAGSCKVTDTINVEVGIERGTLYVPNAFTPDENLLNDVFSPSGNDISTFNMKIFNRFGEQIFESENMEEGWNGKYKNRNVPEGVYVWMITYTTSCGYKKELTKRGHVTLIR